MQIKNPETGEVMELLHGQWVPVAKVPGEEGEKRERLTTGPVNAAMVAAGDTVHNWGLNARDLWASLRGDEKEQLKIADERAEAQDIRARLHEEAPAAAMVGGMLPYVPMMLPGVAGAVPGALEAAGVPAAAAGVGGNLAMGAAQSVLGSQSGHFADDAMSGLGWSGGGMLAGNIVSRVRAGRAAIAEARDAQAAAAALRAQTAGLDAGEQAVIDGARRAGMHVTPGQALNDPMMRQLEASASSNPVLSPYWQGMKQENAAQLNRLTARAMGVEADDVGAAVRAQAEKQIGDTFKEVGADLGSVPTGQLHKELQRLAAEEATQGLPTRDAFGVLRTFEQGVKGRAKAIGAEEGIPDVMAGKDLIDMRSKVARQMRDAFANNKSDRGEVLGDVLEVIDDAIGQAALKTGKPGLVSLYDEARERWTVLRAVNRGGATPDGQVAVGRMAQVLNQSDKTGFWGRADATGKTLQRTGTGKLGEDALGDLYDGIRFASSRIGKDIVGDSGTATRLATSGVFEGGLLPTIGRAVSYAGRRAIVGPLAERYMAMSPEAAQAWQSGIRQGAMAGWMAGNTGGATVGRAGQAGMGAILSPEEAGPYLPPGEGGPAP